MVLREWLKYRYGVFEELRGFPGDQVMMMMIVIVMMMMIVMIMIIILGTRCTGRATARARRA